MSVGNYREYSVLMSVYHKEKPEYLRQAIESIQVQTVPTNDFVLVCDGPLNPELDAVIVEKQQEMGTVLNVVRLAKNAGLGNALNEGIKHCKNTFYSCCAGCIIRIISAVFVVDEFMRAIQMLDRKIVGC